MKKIISIFAVILLAASACQAQNEEDEVQYGFTRSITLSKTIRVGVVGNEVITKIIEISNDTPKTMKIVGFVIPAGIGAMSMQNSVEEFSKGKVQITIDPSIAEKVNGEAFLINVVYVDSKGKEEMQQLPFKIKAD